MEEKDSKIPEEDWFRHAGIENPAKPTDEQVAEAWRTLSDYPVLHALIQDLVIALQRLGHDPKAEKLVKRYKPIANVLLSDSELLLDKLRQDHEESVGDVG